MVEKFSLFNIFSSKSTNKLKKKGILKSNYNNNEIVKQKELTLTKEHG